MVVTPDKGLFYCFAAKVGGDQIALAAHIKGLKTSEAATFLSGNSTVPVPRNRTVPGTVPQPHRKRDLELSTTFSRSMRRSRDSASARKRQRR